MMKTVREGILSHNQTHYELQCEDENFLLEAALEDLQGREVRVSLELSPHPSAKESDWAQGACLWQPSECPMGHQQDSFFEESLQEVGILVNRGVLWEISGKSLRLDRFEGHRVKFSIFRSLDEQERSLRELRGILLSLKKALDE
jgi:hypothetical protein